ncbi:MAG: HEAT repeat domain-containing protein [Candidatus Riflebacteria bacterium]|nr:HEAT repeat domain-containing protein [Candidatus Riflebacteria bacterium]
MPADARSGKKSVRGGPTIVSDLTRHLPAIADEGSLIEAIQSSNVFMRLHGLQNACRFAPHASLPALYRLAETEEDPLVIAALIRSLGEVGGGDEVQRIQRVLGHIDSRVRANALETLAGMPGQIDQIIMERLLADEVPRVRIEAVQYLFTRDPDRALAYFRLMVFGPDNLTRESAFFSLTRIRDSRIISIFRESLKEPRRHVYRQAQQILQSLAGEWPEAAALLAEYRSGSLVGEVIDGEPVIVLLDQLDSPQAVDRIAAIKKLVSCDDPRVEVMLGVNLAARDPEVRHHAALALVQRHRDKTLPRRLEKLGIVFREHRAKGHALVPHALAAQLAALDRDQGGDGPVPATRTGAELYAAFDRDTVFDGTIRRLCGDVRAIHQEIEAFAIRERDARTAAAGSDRGAPGAAQALSDAGRPEHGAAGPASRRWHLAGLVRTAALHTLLIMVAFGAGAWWSRRGASTADPLFAARTNNQLLDLVSLERDPERFVLRFKGRQVRLTAPVTQWDQGARIAMVRSGSILFRVVAKELQGADTVLPGKIVEVDGLLKKLERNGVIEMTGTVRPR